MLEVILMLLCSGQAIGAPELQDNPPVHAWKPEKAPSMTCRLELPGRRFDDDGGCQATLVLRNETAKPITIEYRTHLTMFLDIDIKDGAGKMLPKVIPVYGLIFSPASFQPKGLKTTIGPGKEHRVNIVPFVQVDKAAHPVVAGKYSLRATFRWDGAEVRSDEVQVEIAPAR